MRNPVAAPPMPLAPADSAAGAGPWIERSRLLKRLVAAQPRPTVIVLSAPAGAGKSVLCDQFLARDARPHAVIRLAPYIDEPVVLAGLVLDALEALGTSTQRVRLSLTSEEPAFSAIFLPEVSRLVAASGSDPYVLVLDDVHLLHNSQSQNLLRAIAAALPTTCQLLLLTRDRTPTWLARMRSQGLVFELGASDLAFEVSEAKVLFQGLGATASSDQLEQLIDTSDGWAVGVYLSALATAREGHVSGIPGASVTELADTSVADYLRAEVLDQLDESDREFLLQCSVLDEMTPESCDAVLGRADSAVVLRRLLDRNLLVTKIGDGLRFRCHHLLSHLLVTELAATEPASVPLLEQRAARWFADQGDLDAAVRHAKRSGDIALVAELIWSGIEQCLGSARPDRLRIWLTGLSDHDITSNRWLSLAGAWAAEQAGDLDRMRRWVLVSEQHAGRDWRSHMQDDEYAASLAMLVGLVGETGLQDSVLLCESALRGLPLDSGFRAAAAFIRGVCLTLMRRPVEGTESLVEAEALARALQVPLIQADSLAWRGFMAVLNADYGRASEFISESSSLIELHHLDRLVTSAHCLSARALLMAMRHDPGAAAALAMARRLTVTIHGVGPWFAVCGRLFQARAAILIGDGALARILIEEARLAMTPDLAESLAGELLAQTLTMFQTLSEAATSGAALTAAEMRVLQFLPSHLSFPLIGEHLHLSPNTVKTHALAIYRKLGVSSRDAAVARAHSLGLVDGPLPTD